MDTYEFRGTVFRVGDKVRVMTFDELKNRYGYDESCINFPDGEFDLSSCQNMCENLYGLELTIADIEDGGQFRFPEEETYKYSLNEWYIDAIICEVVDSSYCDDFAEDTVFETFISNLLLGGDDIVRCGSASPS